MVIVSCLLEAGTSLSCFCLKHSHLLYSAPHTQPQARDRTTAPRTGSELKMAFCPPQARLLLLAWSKSLKQLSAQLGWRRRQCGSRTEDAPSKRPWKMQQRTDEMSSTPGVSPCTLPTSHPHAALTGHKLCLVQRLFRDRDRSVTCSRNPLLFLAKQQPHSDGVFGSADGLSPGTSRHTLCSKPQRAYWEGENLLHSNGT